MSAIRAVALAAIWRGDSLLVQDVGIDEHGLTFWRLPGGSIEFGESSQEAVEREILEEIGAELSNLEDLATVENIFTFHGAHGHEFVFAHEATLANGILYEEDVIQATEDDGGAFTLVWKSVNELRAQGHRMVPAGLLDVLENRLRNRTVRP